jgi:hypothetical protein
MGDLGDEERCPKVLSARSPLGRSDSVAVIPGGLDLLPEEFRGRSPPNEDRSS